MAERQRKRDEQERAGGGGDPIGADGAIGNATVMHGSYCEDLPVAGMTVEQVRKRFAGQIDLDPEAIAYIDGEEVEDDAKIGEDDMLLFARRAGEKGAAEAVAYTQEREAYMSKMRKNGMLTIKVAPDDDLASAAWNIGSKKISAVTTAEKFMVAMADHGFAGAGSRGLESLVLPVGTVMLGKPSVAANGNTIQTLAYVCPPQVRTLDWVADGQADRGGHGQSEYRQVTISLPYSVLLIPISIGYDSNDSLRLEPDTSKVECFFCNERIKSGKVKLKFPALLNCSKFDSCYGDFGEKYYLAHRSWLCTQYIHIAHYSDPQIQLNHIVNGMVKGLYDTGFNESSELHEASSWFTESVKKIDDRRIETIEAWERATKKDPTFALKVDWLDSGMTLAQHIRRITMYATNRLRSNVSAEVRALCAKEQPVVDCGGDRICSGIFNRFRQI